MNTSYRSIALPSGQTLSVDWNTAAPVFLAEGEVLLRSSAAWLGGVFVLAPARRVVAPAQLDPSQIQSVTAIRAAKLHVGEAARPLEKLRRALNQVRVALLGTAKLANE
ncbi:MAG TPA: hypothetical protein VLJ86_15755 [Ramlibacter sp.]|nr:hypothetical protein [Ramlibacter sp.]